MPFKYCLKQTSEAVEGDEDLFNIDEDVDERNFNLLPSKTYGKEIMGDRFDYKVSEFGEWFKIISDTSSKSEQLIITAHGCYAPWSREINIPDNVTLKFLNPHGTFLLDPGVSNIASGGDKTFVSASKGSITPEKQASKLLLEEGNLLALTGSDKLGKARNYIMSKYREDDIDTVVNTLSSNRYFSDKGYAIKSDILVVRNRKNFKNLFSNPTLGDVLNELGRNGIHYKTIIVAICRGPLFGSGAEYDSKQP